MNKNSNLTPQIIKIEYVKKPYIDSEEFISGKYALSFISGHDWKDIYFSPGTISFTEKPVDSVAGTLFDQKIEFIHPGESDDSTDELMGIHLMDGVFKITFQNGIKKIIGCKKVPASLDYEFSTKQNGYKVDITCKASQKALQPA